jgi:hypothetical protein
MEIIWLYVIASTWLSIYFQILHNFLNDFCSIQYGKKQSSSPTEPKLDPTYDTDVSAIEKFGLIPILDP